MMPKAEDGLPPGTWAATSCLPEFGGRMVAGRLSMQVDRVRFECSAGTVEWPLAGLQVTLGGHNGHHLFLSRPGVPDAVLSTADLTLLQHPALAGYSALRAQAEKARRQAGSHRRPLLALAVVALLLLGGLVALVAQKDRVVHGIARRIPVEWERQFGEALHAQLARERTFVTNHPAFEAQVRVVTNALLPALRAPGLEFRFHVVQDTNLNAFAIPGGHVYIHTGLLGAVGRPEELAGVLAHEIAHVTQRHGLRKMMESAGLWLAVSSLFGDVQGLAGAVVDGSQFLLTQKYSRDFEREADDVGWDTLVAANVNPRGMIDFFQTLRREEAASAAGQAAAGLSLVSTHPATAERLERLEAKWRRLPRREGWRDLQ